jgi:hypothetical protein
MDTFGLKFYDYLMVHKIQTLCAKPAWTLRNKQLSYLANFSTSLLFSNVLSTSLSSAQDAGPDYFLVAQLPWPTILAW